MNKLNGKILKLREDLTLVSIEDSGALLDIEKRCYHDLNSTAFFIASLLENGYPYNEILTVMMAEFRVDVNTAKPDIDNFIEELQRYGLLSVVEETFEFKKATTGKQGEKLYQTPAFECQKELAVTTAAIGTVEIA